MMPRCSLPLLAFLLCVLGACASGPDIRIDSAPGVDFSRYSTYGFPEQTGTDRGGYETLITDHFKAAVREQMELRGYRYVDENPDLLVNFFANARERTRVRTRPAASTGFGYYGYRYGLYGAWPLYDRDTEVVTYPYGTANVDIVDARQKQLIWEGVAEGRIRSEHMENPRQAISEVVALLFTRFPGKASAVDNTPPSDR